MLKDGHIRNAMRICQRPEGGAESCGPNRARQISCKIQALAVDHRDVGTDRGVFGDIPVEAVGNLDLEILASDMVEKLLGLRVLVVDDRDDLEQLVERNCNGRGLHIARDHSTALLD